VTSTAPTLLPPDYYLGHFHQVIDGVTSRYGFLLTNAERDHLSRVIELSLPARMLYARLVNRRGPCFRIERLAYPEIGALDRPLAELLRTGLLIGCEEDLAPGLTAEVLSCFTHAELRVSLKGQALPRQARKETLLTWLHEWDGRPAWLRQLLTGQPVIRLPAGDPWHFLRFLFFADLRDNLSDFVTQALGHVVLEQVTPEHLRAHFQNRQEADDAYRMATLYATFRRLRDTQSAPETLGWWRGQGIERSALAAGVVLFDRLVDRLGRRLERDGAADDALALYATSPVAPARERQARVLIKRGDRDAARAIIDAMQAAPCHAEEAYAGRQLLMRLEKTSRRSEARSYQGMSRSLVIDYPEGGVEAAVLAHYRSEGWHGTHSENWLWKSGFGLLLWDIIYDPSVGTFHSPLQFAPGDLHEPSFYERRKEAIEDRLLHLADPRAALALMERHFQAKQGIANPFVYWHDELLAVLEVMLHRLPTEGLAAALRHLAQDVGRRSRGLPDLFLWTDQTYRFIEIKSENDQLSAHQYQWLQFLEQAGIHVSLERIERPGFARTRKSDKSRSTLAVTEEARSA
jgi:hypothetical protein